MSCFASDINKLFAACVRARQDMHDYQGTAVQFMRENPFSALFIDLGLGKTISSLTLILDLVTHNEADCVLVIAPLRVANETWPTEIGQWRHTAGLTWAHIRDDDLVEQVNLAGQAARKLIAKHGMEHPEVHKLVSRMRRERARAMVKKAGHHLPNAKELIARTFAKLMEAKEVSADERKEFATLARQVAAKDAVREHKRRNPATIYIVNREQVEFLVNAWGKDWPYDTVIIDESSSLKDHSTKRFKALAKVRPLMKRMHQLTATPAAETYLHLFAQIYLLDLGERLGRNFTDFRDEFFKYNEYTRKAIIRPGAEEEIAKLISDICLTMKAEDYLDLQAPLMRTCKVALSDEHIAMYEQLEKTSLLELPGGVELEAETAAALSNKLLQFASGVVYDTRYEFDPEDPDADGVKVKREHLIHNYKIEKLQQLREEACGEPLLVSYHFKSSLGRIREAFPDAVVMDRAGKAVKAWNAGKIPMLLVHPQSAGHGLNLQHGGRQIVFFDLPWSLELYLQLIGRLARQGQKNIVVVHHLVATGTLDEVVLECLLEKRDAQEELFKLLKRLRSTLSKVTVNNR